MKKKKFVGVITLVITGLFLSSATGMSLSTPLISEEKNMVNTLNLEGPIAPIHSEPIHTHDNPNDMNKGIGKIRINQPGGVLQQFTTTHYCNDTNLYYKFFFGDGTNSGWIGPYVGGEFATATHDYNALGNFTVTAIYKNDVGVESDLSDPTIVRMYLLGDSRPDNVLNFGDIGPFVLQLSSGKTGYYNYLPNGYFYTADASLDGLVNFGDINPWINLLCPPQ